LKKIIFYTYLECSTCPKAVKWLDKVNLEHQLIGIVKEPPLSKHLNLAFEQYSEDKKGFLIPEAKLLNRLILIFIVYQREELLNSF
tara:strand:- start:847 stop:1104 length:258 start_codon:yes stop_codon:yes gene_type:complete